MSENFDPQAMESIVERLKREGRMPTPERLHQVVAETRAEYRAAVEKARAEHQAALAKVRKQRRRRASSRKPL